MEIIPFGTYFKKHFSTKCRAWKYISATRFIIKYESVLHREKGCTGERKKLHIKKKQGLSQIFKCRNNKMFKTLGYRNKN